MYFIVEKDEPLIELPPPKIGETERKIGEYVASLIHDGDTLQLGIGAIPVCSPIFFRRKKNLGIHSEMFLMGRRFGPQRCHYEIPRRQLIPGSLFRVS